MSLVLVLSSPKVLLIHLAKETNTSNIDCSNIWFLTRKCPYFVRNKTKLRAHEELFFPSPVLVLTYVTNRDRLNSVSGYGSRCLRISSWVLEWISYLATTRPYSRPLSGSVSPPLKLLRYCTHSKVVAVRPDGRTRLPLSTTFVTWSVEESESSLITCYLFLGETISSSSSHGMSVEF